MTAPSSWRRALAVLVAAAALAVFATACGDDDSGSAAETTTAPEDIIVSDAEVTAGLNSTIDDMKALQSGVEDGTATQEDYEAAFTQWTTYEGTVKKNNVEAYLGLEDALAGMQRAIAEEDPDAAAQAVTDFEASASAYLAEHP